MSQEQFDVDQVVEMAEGFGLEPEAAFEVVTYLDARHGQEPWTHVQVHMGIARIAVDGRKARMARARAAIRSAFPEILGAEVRKKNGQAAAVFPDATQPGKYRYQAFDERGFFSHSTHNSLEEVLDALVTDGYTEPAPGLLDRLASTETWRQGMARVFEVQKTNASLRARGL